MSNNYVRAAECLGAMSPTMVAALREVHDGRGDSLHGREQASLTHRGLATRNVDDLLVLTPLGAEVHDLATRDPSEAE